MRGGKRTLKDTHQSGLSRVSWTPRRVSLVLPLEAHLVYAQVHQVDTASSLVHPLHSLCFALDRERRTWTISA